MIGITTGTGNVAQLTTRFGFAAGFGSNTFTFTVHRILPGEKKQIRVIDFKRKKTDDNVCRRVGLGGLLARRFAFQMSLHLQLKRKGEANRIPRHLVSNDPSPAAVFSDNRFCFGDDRLGVTFKKRTNWRFRKFSFTGQDFR
jgi:hypothetical protein